MDEKLKQTLITCADRLDYVEQEIAFNKKMLLALTGLAFAVILLNR